MMFSHLSLPIQLPIIAHKNNSVIHHVDDQTCCLSTFRNHSHRSLLLSLPRVLCPPITMSAKLPPAKRHKADDDDKQKTTRAQTAAVKLQLPACRYGASCYRKNPTHFAQFSHPHLDNIQNNQPNNNDKEDGAGGGDERGEDDHDDDGGGGDDDGGDGGGDGDDDGDGGDGDGNEDVGDQAALNSTLRIPCQLQAATVLGTLSDTACYRYAFVPRTQPVTQDARSPLQASKFGGAPFLLPSDITAGTDGAECECGGRMTFSFQLRADDLPAQLANVLVPERLRGADKLAMFQLWLCQGEEHAPWMCDDRQKQLITGARWIDATGTSATPTTPPATPNDTIMQDTGLGFGPEHALLGWERPRIDTPIAHEQQEVWGIEDVDEAAECVNGPKLSGFPDWIQDQAYPQCGECDTRMELLFQTAEDVFTTWIFVCPTHREQFGMEAQCG